MTDSIIGNADIDALRGGVAALKGDVGRLIEHLKGGAINSVRTAAGQFNGQVRGLSEGASAQGERSVKALGAWVEEGPVLAVLLAFGMGYVGGRALSR
jgi:hypothetical protein